jgi:hypothetical protein
LTVNLSGPNNAIISDSSSTVTINNPNPPPSVSISDVAVTAKPGRSTTATFTVSLSAPSDLPTAVTYATADGTAVAGKGYRAIPPTTLSFAPGQTEQVITVLVNPAPAGTPARTFTVNLSSPGNATIADGQATGRINATGSTPPPDPGGGSDNNPPPGNPVVTVTNASFLKKNGKVTALQINFSGPLDPASARNAANYRLLGARHTRKSVTSYTVPRTLVPLSHSADAATVQFTVAGRLKRGTYQLQITSSSSGGVHDPAGQPLVGGNATLLLRA